jgi:hypothetical protein
MFLESLTFLPAAITRSVPDRHYGRLSRFPIKALVEKPPESENSPV